MADNLTPLPVKTLANGDAAVKVVGATTSNVLAVAADGAALVEVKELPAAAALAENMGNPTTTLVGACLAVWDGANWDRVTGDTANGVDVDVTRLPGTAALSDDFANPTALPTGAFLMIWDGSAWDRAPGTSALGLKVDTEMPAAAALSDDFANPTSPAVGAFLMLWDGSTWDRAPGTSALGLTVNTEMPAAAALADNAANPTVPAVGSFLMGYDGSTWDRLRVNGSGELIVSGGGGVTAAKLDTLTDDDVAPSGTATLDSATVGSGKTGKLMRVVVSASVPVKAVISTVLNGTPTTRAVLFTSAAHPVVELVPPTKDFITQAESVTAGFDGFRVVVTNLDNLTTADVYAAIFWDEV